MNSWSQSAGQLSLSIGLGCQMVVAGALSREILARADTALRLATQRGGNRLEILEG